MVVTLPGDTMAHRSWPPKERPSAIHRAEENPAQIIHFEGLTNREKLVLLRMVRELCRAEDCSGASQSDRRSLPDREKRRRQVDPIVGFFTSTG